MTEESIIQSIVKWLGHDIKINRHTKLESELNLGRGDLCLLWCALYSEFCQDDSMHPNDAAEDKWKTVGDVIDAVLACRQASKPKTIENYERHFNDPPTIREMLDKMEEKRTCDAPCLVAMLRLAVDALEQLDEYAHREALQSIERGLWATSPEELWYERPLPMTEKEARECVDLMNREP